MLWPLCPAQWISILSSLLHGPAVVCIVLTLCTSLLTHQFTTFLPQEPKPHEDTWSTFGYLDQNLELEVLSEFLLDIQIGAISA